MGCVLSYEILNVAEAETLRNVEGNMCGANMRGADALPECQTTSRRKGTRRNLGDLTPSVAALSIPDRGRKSGEDEAAGEGVRSRTAA
jgi:hypothetical protein